MALIGTFSRSLLESATAIYFGGVPVNLMDAQGNVLLGEGLPDAPTITSTIADRIYATSDAPATVDLRTKFDGATSYTVSPANAAVSITDYTLTISPTAPMSQTTFTVRGINGGGASEPLTFKLTVNAPTPVLDQPFPDQSLLIGGGSVTLPLAEYFSGAATYAVSPANAGVTISNGNLVISRSTARDVIITVTATNATGQDTSDSFALLIGAPVNQAPVASAVPEQGPVANVAFTVDLSGHFEDPDGDPLIFDYTGTLPTGITRTGAVFSGTATVTGQTANGVLRARDPGNLEAEAPVAWLVAVQPAITAEPFTLTAGQQATIRFNTTPDTVTVAQGSTTLTATRVGTTNDWTFTPATTEPVSIGATKAGWKEYSATITPAGALANIVKTATNTLQLVNVDENTPPFALTMTGRYAGTRTVTPSDMASGPVFHVAPSQSGTAAVGEELTLDQGVVLNFASAGTAGVSYTLLVDGTERPVNGPTYTVQSGDAGKSLVWEVMAQDANGSRSVTTNAIAIPGASGLADGVTRLGHIASVETSSTSTHNISVDLGPADPAKVMYFLIAMPFSPINSLKVIAGGVEYNAGEIQQGTLSGATHRLSLWSCAVPAGGTATLQAGTALVSSTPEVEVLAGKNVTLLSSYKDGVSLTAGSPINRGMGTTQVNDDMLYAIMAAPINAAGVFSGTTGVAEVWDAPVRGVAPQFWVGFGRETVAGTRTLSTTPNASGNASRISAVFRRV